MVKFFKNMSVRYKILTPVTVLGCLILVLGAMSFRSASAILNSSKEISGSYVTRIEQLDDLTASYQSLRRVAFAHLVAKLDKQVQAELNEEADALKQTIEQLCTAYAASLKTSDEKKSFQQFRTDYEAYLAIFDQILDDSLAGNSINATHLANNELKDAGSALSVELDNLNAINQAAMAEAVAHQDAVYASVTATILVILIAGMVVFCYVVWVSWTWCCKRLVNINRQLRDIIATIDAGQGDLTKRVQCFCTDEIGTLASGINSFIQTLQSIMGHITASSGQLGSIVNVVSGKVSTANDNSTDISAIMEQLSASMQEISSTLTSIKGNVEVADGNIVELSDASQGLNDYATGMKQRAEDLEASAIANKQNTSDIISGIINKLNQAIESSKSVERVNDLTNEILSISSQTNLLSLNASIEAARAGEAGRGFAVVADEISQLANSSREAANNIQTINNMVINAVRDLIESANSIVQYINENILPDYEGFVSTGRQYSEDAVHINEIVARFNDMSDNLKELMESIMLSINGINTAVDESASGTSKVALNTSDLVKDIGEIADAMTDNRQIAGTLSEEADRFIHL